jgi:hypothetical protein
MQNDKVLSSQVVCARELGVEAILEEATDIADDGRNDWIEQLGPEGQCEGWRLNGEHVQRSRLRIETRLKLAEKMLPKKYGPALKLAGDPNNDTPIPVGIVMIPPKAKAGG